MNLKKYTYLLLMLAFMLSGCYSEFNHVYKSTDKQYRYEYAKECFARGKYTRASTLLEELVTWKKGTDDAEECLYMLAMAQYCNKDYEAAALAFRKYFSSYPKGKYASLASYYIGQSLFESTPEPRLDQSETVHAIKAFQDYLDVYPDDEYKEMAQDRMIELQDKLVMKELHSAQLYYDLGTYFLNCTMGGNNYEACIITAQNAIKDYPYSSRREEFSLLIMKSKYELAMMSVEEKKAERLQDAEDECYGFLNEYPDSKDKSLAEKYIRHCKKALKGEKIEED